MARVAVYLVTGDGGRGLREDQRGFTRVRIFDSGIPVLDCLAPDLAPAQLQHVFSDIRRGDLVIEAWRSPEPAPFSGLFSLGTFHSPLDPNIECDLSRGCAVPKPVREATSKLLADGAHGPGRRARKRRIRDWLRREDRSLALELFSPPRVC